jgi:hypothetical protein
VALTPEELEEIRKREERKDRLHQNYLRRKANGKVAEDYERTKAKKKAAMDAKKNALRAEDISKGVFVPVSALPKNEPGKSRLANGGKSITKQRILHVRYPLCCLNYLLTKTQFINILSAVNGENE